MRIITVSLSLALFSFTTTGCKDYGCFFNELSDLEVSPATPCLTISLPANQEDSGCADPELSGQNNCTVALTIPGAYTVDGKDQVIAPGATFELDDAAAGTMSSTGTRYTIAATLGTQAITISVLATGDHAGG